MDRTPVQGSDTPGATGTVRRSGALRRHRASVRVQGFRLPQILPRGRELSEEMWWPRHLGLLTLLWLHVPALFLFAVYRGYPAVRGLEVCVPLVLTGLVALAAPVGRQIRCASVAVGLVLASAILVYLSGGSIEAHFHYFVVIAFLSLYQLWMPFLIAVVFVLFEHGIIAMLDPRAVYDHSGMPGMQEDPWKWTLIHAGFLFAASVANLLAWRLTEQGAMHDGLTGLPNRELFMESLNAAHEQGMSYHPAVLFIDLDNFKDANDGFGHDQGDALLRAIAARLGAATRRGDTVGRLGGDEFGVVLRQIEDPAQALAAAQRYLAVFEDPFTLDGGSLVAGASIGLALGDEPGSLPSSLMRNADLAMYDAKRAGGRQISRYQPEMLDVAVQRAMFEAEMHGALDRGEFVVHYQPLISVQSGEIVGNEALIRWEHPTRGLIAPGEFITTAEQSGFIVPLGRWVLRTACQQTKAWHAEHPDQPPLNVSVNLSPRQLADRQLIDMVVEALRDAELPSQYLCLEITEGAVIKNFDGALPRLRALKVMGISLALDDFGTGYSSLSYLRQLPVDSLKIDRSFITDLTEGRDHHIVAAIIDLAHALGMSVTAEGVETEEQLAMLRTMSSNLAQGYLIARPMPAAQMTLLLDQRDRATRHPAAPTGRNHRAINDLS